MGEALRFGGYRKSQLDEVKRTRGERVEDGTAQRDKPLFQVRSPNPLDTPVVLQLMRMRLHDFPCLSFADPTGEQGEEGCGVQRALQTQYVCHSYALIYYLIICLCLRNVDTVSVIWI